VGGPTPVRREQTALNRERAVRVAQAVILPAGKRGVGKSRADRPPYLSRPGRITETPTIIPAMKAINIRIRIVWISMLTTLDPTGRQRREAPSILRQPASLRDPVYENRHPLLDGRTMLGLLVPDGRLSLPCGFAGRRRCMIRVYPSALVLPAGGDCGIIGGPGRPGRTRDPRVVMGIHSLTG
jgi:hypothetical protein